MTGVWETSAERNRRALPPPAWPPGGRDRRGASDERYPTGPVRPATQLVARIGLLTAIGVGCVAGVAGLLRSPGGVHAAPEPVTSEDTILPGSVAGVAELAVRRWLTATDDDRDALEAIFVEPPAPAGQRYQGVSRVAERLGRQPRRPARHQRVTTYRASGERPDHRPADVRRG